MVRGGNFRNVLQGDFGEAWLGAVAAGCDLIHGRPSTVDLDKADVLLTKVGLWEGTYSPTVMAQVKTTTDLRRLGSGAMSYDLDVATFNVLCRTDHAVRRVLVVIGLSDVGEKVVLQDGGTLLVGAGGWVSLEGLPPSENQATEAVELPLGNTLDRVGLERMLREYGVRRSTPVPDLDLWSPE